MLCCLQNSKEKTIKNFIFLCWFPAQVTRWYKEISSYTRGCEWDFTFYCRWTWVKRDYCFNCTNIASKWVEKRTELRESWDYNFILIISARKINTVNAFTLAKKLTGEFKTFFSSFENKFQVFYPSYNNRSTRREK